VLFEKLVQQHRVYRFVAHGLGLTFGISRHQIGIDVGYFLGNQAELQSARSIDFFLVTEADRLECQNGFTGFIHRFDVLFDAPSRSECAYLVVGIDINCSTRRDGRVNVSDTGRVALPSNTQNRPTDTDIATAGGEITADIEAQCGVVRAGVVQERTRAVGRVIDAGSIAKKRSFAGSRVVIAGCVEEKRGHTDGRVKAAGGVAIERLRTVSRIKIAVVVKGGLVTGGRVIRVAVAIECLVAGGRITVTIREENIVS